MVSDYYPFGMEMPGRQYASEAYRYSYQGQFAEKDEETGFNSFKFRGYDSRIGRWNSVDMMGQHYSPFMAMNNSPILYIDKDGNVDWKVVGSGFMGVIGGGSEVWLGVGTSATGIGAVLGVGLVVDGGTRVIFGVNKMVAGFLEKPDGNNMVTNIGGATGWVIDGMPNTGVGVWQQSLSTSNDVLATTSGSLVNAHNFSQIGTASIFLKNELSNVGLFIIHTTWDYDGLGDGVIDFGMMDEIEVINGVDYGGN